MSASGPSGSATRPPVWLLKPNAGVPPVQAGHALLRVLRGNIDVLNVYRIAGWVQDESHANVAVSLLVLHNGEFVDRVIANRYRADLETAGVGNGWHSFDFNFPVPLAPSEPHVIRLLNEVDGSDALGSPFTIEPRQDFNGAAEQAIADTLAQCGGPRDLPRKIDFMTRQLDRLVQQYADTSGHRLERSRYRHLRERWKRRLSDGVAPAGSETAPGAILRALVLDDRIPDADRDAGSRAILSHASSLQRLGYDVTFVPTADFEPAERELARLHGAGMSSCCGPYYGSVEEVLRRQAGEFDVVYLHRVGNAAKYLELVRQHFPRARCLFSVADLHHLRLARQIEAEDRTELRGHAERVRLAETVAAASADAVITHSSFEAEILRKTVSAKRVHTIPWDVRTRPTPIAFAKRHGVAFIGGFAHQPNRDAARWLIGEIMPLVRKRHPYITCALVGSELPPEIAALCGSGVAAVGQVKDLMDIFDRVRLTVAPLGYGAGVKGKVVDSLAAGVPCVCTPVAAEGLDWPDPLGACVADGADRIADAIVRLHEDESFHQSCRNAGLDFTERQWSEGNVDTLMRRALGLREAS